MSTSQIAKEFINGNKLYQKKAKEALPVLVRQAQADQKIYYSDLAYEIIQEI